MGNAGLISSTVCLRLLGLKVSNNFKRKVVGSGTTGAEKTDYFSPPCMVTYATKSEDLWPWGRKS